VCIALLTTGCTIDRGHEGYMGQVRVEVDCHGPCDVMVDGKRQETNTTEKKEVKK
jgi:hypothetical protein